MFPYVTSFELFSFIFINDAYINDPIKFEINQTIPRTTHAICPSIKTYQRRYHYYLLQKFEIEFDRKMIKSPSDEGHFSYPDTHTRTPKAKKH